MKLALKIGSLFFCLLWLNGCTRTELAFRFADTAVASKADDYFDLSSAQQSELKKSVQKDIDLVRKNLFPILAKKLRSLEPLANNSSLDPALVESTASELQGYFKLLPSYFLETSVKTALDLTPQQFDHFSEEIRQEIKKDKENPKDIKKEWEKKYRRSLEFWIGGISVEQRKAISEFVVKNPYPLALQNQSRQHVLSSFLQASKNPESLKKFITEFSTDYESLRLQTFKEALQVHKKSFQKFFATDFWPTLTAVQRQRLAKTLISRAEELERMASKP